MKCDDSVLHTFGSCPVQGHLWDVLRFSLSNLRKETGALMQLLVCNENDPVTTKFVKAVDFIEALIMSYGCRLICFHDQSSPQTFINLSELSELYSKYHARHLYFPQPFLIPQLLVDLIICWNPPGSGNEPWPLRWQASMLATALKHLQYKQ